MASAPQWTDAAVQERLRTIPGVEDVVTGADGIIWLVCSPELRRSDVEKAAHEALAELSISPDQHVEIVVRAASLQRERVRFDSIERTETRDNRIRVAVSLEWGGESFLGEASGERGDAIEIRTAAAATIAALEKAVGAPLNLRLIGVKQVRAFDAELAVVSLNREDDHQKLVGIVVVGDNPRRAAALAVLNALNRSLGNRLTR